MWVFVLLAVVFPLSLEAQEPVAEDLVNTAVLEQNWFLLDLYESLERLPRDPSDGPLEDLRKKVDTKWFKGNVFKMT